ncbi:MAG: hypothetical protein OXU20_40145 [Myxococcales bacterium]|nr:hypothetical protein [Myxococcales bacterium]
MNSVIDLGVVQCDLVLDRAATLRPLLASHGFAILLTTPTGTLDQPPARGEDLQAAIEQVAQENSRAGHPLEGKLASDRVCATGHSMGGGLALWAAQAGAEASAAAAKREQVRLAAVLADHVCEAAAQHLTAQEPVELCTHKLG